MINTSSLVVIAIVVVLLFGTKKLKTLGSDLGESIKGFKKAMSEEQESTQASAEKNSQTEEIKTATTNNLSAEKTDDNERV